MKVRLWSKQYTQSVLKDLRKKGFEVKKENDGFYKAFDNDIEVFSCLLGRNDYICRLNPDYFDTESS